MKISKIEINNFKQYYGNVSIDLDTNDKQNIILIGGKNGYGKTNLLLSIVWCLYGEKLDQIDDNFKKEIQKLKNYSSFMQQSLNWTAKKNNQNSFSVSLRIDEVDLPIINNKKIDSVTIHRKFDVASMISNLSIKDTKTNLEIFNDNELNIEFINDYLIPIDAAKFVFFDAEKISEIANLPLKEEGSFINDALGKILGLDIYDTLINELKFYVNSLRKKGAVGKIYDDINLAEIEINNSEDEIESLEQNNFDLENETEDLERKIRRYEDIINNHSNKNKTSFDRTLISQQLDALRIKEIELKNTIDSYNEVFPLIILSGKIEEVNEHLKVQDNNNLVINSSTESNTHIEQFIDELFNKEPLPKETSLTLPDMFFYYEKAKKLSKSYFNIEQEIEELYFEHDLNNSDKNLVFEALKLLNNQSVDLFETTFKEYSFTVSRILELEQNLFRADADEEEELILNYISSKEKNNFNRDEKIKKIGENDQQIKKLKEKIRSAKNKLSNAYKNAKINKQNQIKIQYANSYIDVLNSFLEKQKEKHKENLENTILKEMKVLMHKLNSKDNTHKLIKKVKVSILASGHGMQVTLQDQDSTEILKESLSSGEKQIYISCLIKALLTESVQNLPIFIDTPLGRLDEEHKESLINLYYPNLSEQVVLLSTNSEITPKRYLDIIDNISKSYTLDNKDNNTKVKEGYFKNSTHD